MGNKAQEFFASAVELYALFLSLATCSSFLKKNVHHF